MSSPVSEDLPVPELVRALYRVLLLREPDPKGFNTYVGGIRNGLPIEDVIRRILRSKEFTAENRAQFLKAYLSTDSFAAVAASTVSQAELGREASGPEMGSPPREPAEMPSELERDAGRHAERPAQDRTIGSVDVMVTAFARPNLLSQLAQSLAQQVGVADLRLRIYLFQDSPIVDSGPPIRDPELCLRSADVFLTQLPDAKLLVPETNLGITGNTGRIFEHVKTSDADAFVIFEEDLVLSEHYIATIAQSLTEAAANPLIGLVNAVPDQVRDLETQQQRPSALVNMGHKWSVAFDRRTYRRMANYLDAYFAICRNAGFRCNGRDRPESIQAVQHFFHELGFPNPHAGTGPDSAFDVFSYLYMMHNVSTWVCYARYTGRSGAHFRPDLYDRMNLGAVQFYDRRVAAFDIPSLDQSLTAVQTWRIRLLERHLATISLAGLSPDTRLPPTSDNPISIAPDTEMK